MAAYLKYVLKNTEPLRISDDSTSQSGQTDTLSYIPGSAVRGIVVNAFSRDDDFESLKADLFSSETAFLNAYPVIDGKSLIPSPKGFYEDKTLVEGKKFIDNIMENGPAESGHKRAGLGRYCYLEDDCIHYYSIDKGADLKININHHSGEKNLVFRSEYIAAGQSFEGYIKVSDKALEQKLIKLFEVGNCVILGNSRTSGMGKCKIIDAEIIDTCPMYSEVYSAESKCYMMLLSDTVMRNDKGDYCGIDTDWLGKMLRVDNLSVEECATSVRHLNGYNRTLGIKLPSVTVYVPGSVFKLSYDGTITPDAMEKVMDSGIGIRRNEGLGRVFFPANFAGLSAKQPHNPDKINGFEEASSKNLSADENEALLQIAFAFYKYALEDAMEKYIIENNLRLGGISKSRAGTIESLIINNKYRPAKLKSALDNYFEHELAKEAAHKIQKDKASVRTIKNQIDDIWNTNLDTLLFANGNPFDENGKIMGIERNRFFNENAEQRCKINLLVGLFKNSRKTGGK